MKKCFNSEFHALSDHQKQFYCMYFSARPHTQIQEMRGNIRVFCRCRHDNSARSAITFPSDTELQVVTQQGHVKKFEFEKVFQPTSKQTDVSHQGRMCCASPFGLLLLLERKRTYGNELRVTLHHRNLDTIYSQKVQQLGTKLTEY